MNELTREQKVKSFFALTHARPRWCKPGPMGCGCMGCVNMHPGELKTRWYRLFPDEPYLTEEDVKIFNAEESK